MRENKNILKRSVFYLIIPVAVLFLFVSCEKNITVKIQPYQGMLSIQCMLVPGEVPKLYLSQSTGFFSSQITPADLFVHGARVIISSPETRDSLITTMGRDSFYCQDTYFYQGKFIVKQGLTYNMEVTYDGKTYRSSTTINQQKPMIEKVGYVSAFKDIYGEHEGVVVDFTDITGQVNTYRIEMSRQIDSSARKTEAAYKSECNGASFFTVKEVGRAIYFDIGSGDGRPVSVTVEPTYSHHNGSVALVYLQAMDPLSARFFDQLDKQKLATSNPFVEPVFLTSNINGCMGVFGHYVRSEPVQFIYPE